ncbi:lipid-A-disaccharide synthase [Lentisalinibacter sediminis]|uniref:lipid-A-disaccharide synthase n=1 Tax=Lentisalinibacter sediminis TaxID=2992237 RepID=UPI0038686A11
MARESGSPLIAVVAGEASGDRLGAGLIAAIRERCPDARFEGVAGPAMREAGCEVLFDTDALAVMGIAEVLGHLPRLFSIRRSLVRRWSAAPPDLLVGIDAPDFNLGLEKKLRRRGVITVQYVSPSVWAWRPRRLKKIRKACDRVLCLLPFEKRFYDERGLDAVFVGHPRAETIPRQPDAAAARRELGLTNGGGNGEGRGEVVALLPGSRAGEVGRLAPHFIRTAQWLARRRPGIRFVAALAGAGARSAFEAALAEVAPDLPVTLCDSGVDLPLAACDAALVTSGTATLEAALYGRPMVVAYRLSPTTLALVRSLNLIRVENFALPNLLAGRTLVPEFLQEEAVAERMGPALAAWLDDPERRTVAEREFARIHAELARGADGLAAQAVLEMLPGAGCGQ